ncbi:MAG: hypothetical protein DCC49_12540 [Acidobacteria bacterium]|nr:MAG: hypothetical protein DCC49_12540 [Acidobacteriota bacterium]
MTRVFDDCARSDETILRHGESRFDFLNRTSREFFRHVCDEIEVWYQQSCPEKRPELRMRLRSSQFNEAFWELFIETLLRKHGWDVSCHPSIPKSEKSPDFLVEIPPDRPTFYVEATVSKHSGDESANEARLGSLTQYIEDNVQHPRFMLDVSVACQGPSDPPKADLIREIGGLLAGLDPDAVASEFDTAKSLSCLPSRTWERDGWRITIRALPVKAQEEPGSDRRIIGMSGPAEASIVNLSGPLKKSISRKATRYGLLRGPFVVAIWPRELGTTDQDIATALFGSEAVTSHRGVAGSARMTRRRDGLWIGPSGPINQRVSAILTPPGDYAPWTAGKGILTVWHNPWAGYPLALGDSVFREMRVDGDGAIVESAPGKAPGGLLGLPSDWPGPEPPFD